ncbi:MAG: hypothetical protein KA163_01195 [Bacteroidia bacterium]|nr:hypothetical protein [Bacteroidia bacterium]
MKTIFIILITAMLYNTASAQSNKVDSIFWHNGDVSLLSELGTVWIILKKGSDLKDVRIREIKKEKGMIVYEKEKTLHDVYISNIKKIQAGKHSMNSMYFHTDNTPYIKADYLQIDPMFAYSEFKSLKINVQAKEEEAEEQPETEMQPVAEKKPVVTQTVVQPINSNSTVCDTIIDLNGNVIQAKITEITSTLVSYKKTNNLNGPIYIKSLSDAEVTRYSNHTTINFSK